MMFKDSIPLRRSNRRSQPGGPRSPRAKTSPRFQFGEVDLAGKHEICSAGQKNMVVRRSPVDHQTTTVERDLTRPRGKASARARSHGGTGSRSAGARNPHASLPNTHAQLSRLKHADEFDIDPLALADHRIAEVGARLQDRAKLRVPNFGGQPDVNKSRLRGTHGKAPASVVAGGKLARDRLGITGTAVGVAADRAGRAVVALADGRIALRSASGWTVTQVVDEPAPERHGTAPAASR